MSVYPASLFVRSGTTLIAEIEDLSSCLELPVCFTVTDYPRVGQSVLFGHAEKTWLSDMRCYDFFPVYSNVKAKARIITDR